MLWPATFINHRVDSSSITAGCFLGAAAVAGAIPRLNHFPGGLNSNESVRVRSAPGASSRKRPHPGVGAVASLRRGSKDHRPAGRNTKASKNNQRQPKALAQVQRVAKSEIACKKGTACPERSPGSSCPADLVDEGSVCSAEDPEEEGTPQTLSPRHVAPTSRILNQSVTLQTESKIEPAALDVARSPDIKATLKTNKANMVVYDHATATPSSHCWRFPGPHPTQQFLVDTTMPSPLLPDRYDPSSGRDIVACTGAVRAPSTTELLQTKGKLSRSGKEPFSRRLDGIMAVYSSNDAPSAGAIKGFGKRGRGRGGTDGFEKNGLTRWREKPSRAAAAAAAGAAASRMRQLEAMMDAALQNPVTYEEQLRRERLAHLRMMYTVSKLRESIRVDCPTA